ncbi:acyltransferase [Lacimicrobium sp. SS2-24]|uniref:LpxL/LpxP family acyltransferase n=1 Tax=Lacimicrobium sp. SS2-24 TaxID=2005569 RepID=UPI001FEE0A6F|nr:acyltransferase [Lacimicrobium sp. SS2-24]
MSRHWSALSERGSLMGMLSLLWIYRLLGRRVLWLFLAPVVFYFFTTSAERRRSSQQFLRRVSDYNHKQKAPSRWCSLKHYCVFADSAFDKIDAWLGRIRQSQICYQNKDDFDRLQRTGKGAVFIGSHLGNLEVCRALSQGKYATRINVLVFTANAVKFNQLLHKINPNVSMDMIQVSEASPALLMMLKERVEQGEFVVIVGDRTSISVAGRVCYADFMGQPAPFSQGPFILASLLECPVYLLFCLKQQQYYRVIFEPFAPEGLMLPRKQRQARLEQFIQSYAQRLAYWAAQYPLQWFNFYDFWQQDESVSRQFQE